MRTVRHEIAIGDGVAVRRIRYSVAAHHNDGDGVANLLAEAADKLSYQREARVVGYDDAGSRITENESELTARGGWVGARDQDAGSVCSQVYFGQFYTVVQVHQNAVFASDAEVCKVAGEESGPPFQI
jgi:hypothetical protein